MADQVTEMRFWEQVVGDSKRTVLCSPDLESRCKGMVAAHGLDHLITVKASRAIPDGRIYVIDEQALAAEARRVGAPVRVLPIPRVLKGDA